MIKTTNLKETDQIQPLILRAYIAKKITAMMQEYQVDNLDDIGCFIVLESEEFTSFPIVEMEFVEMLFLEESMFLHGVKIIGDSYGEDMGRLLRLKEKKMAEGKELIRFFCTLHQEADGSILFHDKSDAPKKWEKFKAYNRRDVEVELKIQRYLSEFPVPEFVWEEFYIDQEINDRGILVDTSFAKKAVELDGQVKKALLPKLKELTGLDNPNSPVQMKEWLMCRDIETDTLDKKFMQKISGSAPEEVQEVLRLYQQLSRSSVQKYTTMLRVVCADGRARGMFSFYGANRTGRFAGRLIQLQNLPQNHLDDLAELKEQIRTGEFDTIKENYDDVPDVLSQLIRTAFIPPEGKKYVVADFSAIEARVLAWLADEKWRMQAFANGEDIYCASASKMFGVPVEKNGTNGHLRQKGKIAELACGYGGSIGAIKAMGGTELKLSDDDLFKLVDDWRNSSPNIVKFWGDVQRAAEKVITDQCGMTCGKLRFSYESGIFFIELSSRRRLAYVRPKVEKDQRQEYHHLRGHRQQPQVEPVKDLRSKACGEHHTGCGKRPAPICDAEHAGHGDRRSCA